MKISKEDVYAGGGRVIYKVYVHMKKAELKDEHTTGNVYLCVHTQRCIRDYTCVHTHMYINVH